MPSMDPKNPNRKPGLNTEAILSTKVTVPDFFAALKAAVPETKHEWIADKLKKYEKGMPAMAIYTLARQNFSHDDLMDAFMAYAAPRHTRRALIPSKRNAHFTSHAHALTSHIPPFAGTCPRSTRTTASAILSTRCSARASAS